ncbi:MAG: beta-L-arabinofuranosidase domain-containing protein, partial [Christensenellaceae bacterium]
IGEAFTVDYDLPGDTAYAETCASIGLMFFASRMLEISPEAKYADTMERAFYNTVLAGMQSDGKKFFYVNPLETVPGITGKAATQRHVCPVRPNWYSCACCPPNLARIIMSIGRYAYGASETRGYCHLYADGDVSFGNGLSVTCKTAYPYGFSLTYFIHGFGELAVRIPEWSDETSYWKNGRICMPFFENGYAVFHVGDGDEIRIFLSGAPKYIYPNPKIPALTAKTCIVRGPLVYCFEEADNGPVLPLRIDDEEPIQIGEFNEALGVMTLHVKGYRSEIPSALYTPHRPKEVSCTLTAIPYYAWANRGENQMRVWMPRTRTEDEA